jgi:hypothetical protein
MRRLLALTFVSAAVVATTAQDVTLEYRVKAAYLFNFTKFVEWPATAFEPGGRFGICIAEANPFGPVLTSTLVGEVVAGRMLAARVVRGAVDRCQVLFVPRAVAAAPYLRRTMGQPILTVGESAEFLQQGGMINLIVEEGKVRFEIDQEAVMRQRLTISSRLLRLARPPDRSGI